MDDFKEKISEGVLNTLTLEDLSNSPKLRNSIQEKYHRAYIEITGPMREFCLYKFIKIAESKYKMMQL